MDRVRKGWRWLSCTHTGDGTALLWNLVALLLRSPFSWDWYRVTSRHQIILVSPRFPTFTSLVHSQSRTFSYIRTLYILVHCTFSYIVHSRTLYIHCTFSYIVHSRTLYILHCTFSYIVHSRTLYILVHCTFIVHCTFSYIVHSRTSLVHSFPYFHKSRTFAFLYLSTLGSLA